MQNMLFVMPWEPYHRNRSPAGRSSGAPRRRERSDRFPGFTRAWRRFQLQRATVSARGARTALGQAPGAQLKRDPALGGERLCGVPAGADARGARGWLGGGDAGEGSVHRGDWGRGCRGGVGWCLE